MNQSIEIFTGFLQNLSSVFYSAESFGVFSIFLHLPYNEESFLKEFNRWNENHGLIFSVAKLKDGVFVVYFTNNNGVQITDLTKV